MDELPVPVSASVFPTAAAAAASFCKPVAIAKPMLRTTQLAEPSASSRIKSDHATSKQLRQNSPELSVCPYSQRDNVAGADNAHVGRAAAKPSAPKRSRDSDCARAAPNAVTCPHASSVPSIGDVFRQLAACSFYFGRLSASEASRKLAHFVDGTFLLRDSSDRRFLFALSIQTHRGPTSVRLTRDESGRFRLDCDRAQRSAMPTFASVVELVRYYFRPTADRHCVLIDSTTGSIPVRLTSSLTSSGSPSTLAHLSRINVHRARLRRSLERTASTRQAAEARTECVECFVDSLPTYVDQKAKTFLLSYPFDL